MTEQELTEQLESQNRIIAELRDSNTKSLEAIKAAEAKAAAAVPSDYEALKKQATAGAEAIKQAEQLKSQLTLAQLQMKYPSVDLTLVPAGDPAAMEATASKLQAMLDKQAAAFKAANPQAPAPKPGERWATVPPLGGVDQDAAKVEADRVAAQTKLADAQKTGDLAKVFDACAEQQPGAMKHLFSGKGPGADRLAPAGR